MLATGDTLDGRYRLDRSVATGGAGQVWQSTDTVLGRQVAVKILHGSAPDHASFAARFLDEARTMAALHHPGVVDVYDYGEADDVAYLVMAYVEGEPLSEHIARRGRLASAEATPIIAQVARALDAVHEAGVIHRDVKPGNLILQPDGTVVLVDFGIAHAAQSAYETAGNEVVGTPLYIAPEQVTKQPITPATDVYALGAVAYHCLAGRPPFLGDNPITVALQHLNDDPPPLPDDVPQVLRSLVATAMAKDPDERFPTAAAMAEAAEAAGAALGPAHPLVATALLDEAVVAGPASPARRNRAVAAALALTALALLSVLALLIQTDATPTIPGLPTNPMPGPTGSTVPATPAGGTEGEPAPSESAGQTGPPASERVTPAPATTSPPPAVTTTTTTAPPAPTTQPAPAATTTTQAPPSPSPAGE